MSIGWGIVSLGRHATNKMAPAINAGSDGKLAAVYSRNMRIAEEFAEHHSAGAAYDTVDALLNDPNVDAVYVSSPNALHHQQTIEAARAGKHVLCEKPMALTVEDCEEMIAVCERARVRLGLCFHARHHPLIQEARKVVQEGTLGVVALVEAQWGSGLRGHIKPPTREGRQEWREHSELAGAGAFMDSGVHVVDLTRFILGQEVVEITAMADTNSDPNTLENLATVLLRYEDGSLGMVCAGRRLPDPRRDAVVYGSDGRAALYDALSTDLQGTLEVKAESVNKTITHELDPIGMYRRMVDEFNQAILEDKEPNASGFDGLQVARVAQAFRQSVETGRSIKLAQP